MAPIHKRTRPIMLSRLVFLVTATVLLVGCHSPGADCASVDGWQQGKTGAVRMPGCVNDNYAEAHELGRSLRELQDERDAIDLQIAEQPDEASALRRRQRQIDIDIEAIQGLAVIEGWVAAAPN